MSNTIIKGQYNIVDKDGIVPHPLFLIRNNTYELITGMPANNKFPGYTAGTNTVIANLIYKRCKELNIF